MSSKAVISTSIPSRQASSVRRATKQSVKSVTLLSENSQSDSVHDGDVTTRKRIFASAKHLFYMFGFSRVTMDEIAQELGMSKKTLYKHYATKDDIVREIVTTMECEMSDYTKKLIASKKYNFIEKHILMGHFIGTRIGKQSVVFWSDLQKYAPELYVFHNKRREETIRTNFQTLIQQGKKQGYLRKDADAHVVMLSFLAIIEGVFNPTVVSTLPLTPASLYAMIVRNFFEGVFTDHGRHIYQDFLGRKDLLPLDPLS